MWCELHLIPLRCNWSIPHPRKYATKQGPPGPCFVLKGAIRSESLAIKDKNMLAAVQLMGISRVEDMPAQYTSSERFVNLGT
jgi:hypothetical protein